MRARKASVDLQIVHTPRFKEREVPKPAMATLTPPGFEFVSGGPEDRTIFSGATSIVAESMRPRTTISIGPGARVRRSQGENPSTKAERLFERVKQVQQRKDSGTVYNSLRESTGKFFSQRK